MTLNAAIISESFERAKKENGGLKTLGLRFYERLFEKYPSVRHLFQTPPEEQHKKLMASIAAIVSSVNNPDVMLPYLRAMGIRHIGYKTEDGHYAAVAENLLAVLDEHLSKEGEWTPDMYANWKEAIDIISNVMIDAAHHPEKYRDELFQAGFQADGLRVGQLKPWEMALS
jgi:hemoglobin-like flavoprotein